MMASSVENVLGENGESFFDGYWLLKAIDG